MAKVIWTEPALQDLNEIAEYIALDKVSAAKKLVQNVFVSTDRLEQFPRLGRSPPELDDFNYLELIVKPCRIFYRIEKETVYIVYVMRSERALRNFLLHDRTNNSK